RMQILDTEGRPVAGLRVHVNQIDHAFRHGVNIFMLDEFENEAYNTEYRRLFREYFNLATVPFFWKDNEREEGKPRYAKDSPRIYRRPPTDLCVEYCEENGILPKLHCLVYDEWTPDWAINLPLPELKKKYEKRFREIAERYSGRMYEFEVINEVLRLKKDGYRLSAEPDVIAWAFGLAREVFPNETLLINEAAMVPWMRTEDPYYLLIRDNLQNGVSIDKIVMQNQLYTGVGAHTPEEYERDIRNGVPVNDPENIFRGLDVMASLGLPLEIGEVTVPTFGETEEDEQLQADMLRLWYSIWFSHPAVESVLYWNTPEGYAHSFNDNWVENRVRGGLFHHDLTPKKSALMLKKLFDEEWHTEGEYVTDTDGILEFRGFFGKYDIAAVTDGKQDSRRISFQEHTTAPVSLVL
ncbi:MAG: endo-1,4-beta-xylanase, partial [Clostridia bacterium]|nr:endo-1,4-beta-xylanase [Clostridia bacterium]